VVNVWATTGPLVIAGGGGNDTVNIGNATPDVQSISGALTIQNTGGATILNINDGGDLTAQTVDINDSSGTGTITGLAPALISYVDTDVSALNVFTGSGGNTVTVHSAVVPILSRSSTGSDTVISVP
jgi:hypothetical protein